MAAAANRTVLFLGTPALWPAWPFLPLVRRNRGTLELGVMIDSLSLGITGRSSTVYLANLLDLPGTLTEFLALPHETFDSAEEVASAGWLVD
jgi:hypothetical protein